VGLDEIGRCRCRRKPLIGPECSRQAPSVSAKSGARPRSSSHATRHSS